jgi:hypothetical protein
MRKVLHLRNQWAELAGLPLSGQTDLQQIGLQQETDSNSKQNDRDNRLAEPPLRLSSRRAGEHRRLPASAILAAVAGRL